MIVSFSVANDTFYLVTNTIRVGVLLSVLGLVVNTTVVTVLALAFPRLGVAYGLAFTLHLEPRSHRIRGLLVPEEPSCGPTLVLSHKNGSSRRR